MIYIDFEGKTPVNTPAHSDIPSWKPWTQDEWKIWLEESKRLLDDLERLHGNGTPREIKARNKFIDDNSAHWGKLKDWLKVLSYGKCWFSEVRELYSHYDVEHFRPKKEAKGLSKECVRDGYWWLSFEYTNYRLCGNVGNRKKGGWFPLKQKSLVSEFNCQCEESETYYLLDPTDPYDPSLLAFDEEGNAIPSPTCQSDWEKVRVMETIKRLKLTEHEALTEGRKKIWQKVNQEIDLYLAAKTKLSHGGNPGIKEKVKSHLRIIREHTSKNAELSSVAKWCILFRNEEDVIRIIA